MGLKAAVFDFDDTLCVHPIDVIYGEDEDRRYNMLVMKGDCQAVYGRSRAPLVMRHFVSELYKKGIPLYVLSQCNWSQHLQLKRDWVQMHYGDVFEGRVHSVGLRNQKVEFLQTLANHLGCDHTEILLVDDNGMTVQECRKEGFIVIDSLNVLACDGNIEFTYGDCGNVITVRQKFQSALEVETAFDVNYLKYR